jgi:NitT/TauT family transport system substrate-binding protein
MISQSLFKALRRALVPLAAGLALTVGAQAQTPTAPKKVRIAIGTRVVNIAYPWLTMPAALGYWKAEGYDVEVVPMGGSLEAVQQLVAGNVDFVQINSGVVVQSNVNNKLALRSVLLSTVNDWSVVAVEGGPIRDVKDFKGKSIGVPALSTGGMPLLKEFLRANGLEPDVDVSIVAVGFGAPAYEAIRSNKVQGLLFFQAAITGFENAGGKFRYFHGADWRQQPDFTLATNQKTIDADPAMVEAIARGALKGLRFALASPDCTRRVHWKRWPDTRPSGAPDEATQIKWDLANLDAQLSGVKQAYALSGSKYWGAYTPQEYGTLQDFLVRAELIKSKLPAESYIVGIPGFYEKINAFDAKAIQTQAEACVGY